MSEAYNKLITNFLDKYETILSKNMISALSDVYNWIAKYDENMKTGDAQAKIQYMKRGSNLMKKFVEQYKLDSSDMRVKLTQCRQALLGVGGVKLPTWCTEETKNKLLKFAIDIRVFTKEIIGCIDASNKFFLDKLKKVAELLGKDYVKIKNDLEEACIHIRIEQLNEK